MTSQPPELSDAEHELLKRHLSFYRDLATGKREPTTDAQRHFADVAHGRAKAETDHEIAYAKWMRLHGAAVGAAANMTRMMIDERGPAEEWLTAQGWKQLRQISKKFGRD